MFEGRTSITFHKQAACELLTKAINGMFAIEVEVMECSACYDGLRIDFVDKKTAEAEREKARIEEEQEATDG